VVQVAVESAQAMPGVPRFPGREIPAGLVLAVLLGPAAVVVVHPQSGLMRHLELLVVPVVREHQTQ